jgi:hypothetical protein
MTSLSEAREQVYQTWVDNVPSGLDSWTFENEEGFDEPDQDKCWARVLMRSIGGGQETLGASGGRKFRRTASVLVEIFTPRGRGLGKGDDLAHAVRDIYEARSIGGLDFTDGTVVEVPPSADSKTIQHLVQVLFDYEEKK